MYMYTNMTIPMAKTIAIANDVYEMLSKEKRSGESFSDVLRRIGTRGGSLLDCAGILKGLTEKEFQRFRSAALSVDRPASQELGWHRRRKGR